MPPGFLIRAVNLLLAPLLTRLSDQDLRNFVVNVVSGRAESLSAADALRFVLSLDASLYSLQGWLSVRYGGGAHTKHRHTRYHDFFVHRIKPGERVLDVGCGIGALTFDVARRAGASLVGIDFSLANITTARTKYCHEQIVYVVGDALKSPLKGPFDTIILSNVLEHVEARKDFLRGIMEAMRPARLLLRVPVFERDWRVPLKQELGIDYRLDPTHFTEYTLESFSSELDEAGLRVTHQEVRWGEIWAEATGRDPWP